MFSIRPAYPPSFYLFAIAVSIFLLTTNEFRSEQRVVDHRAQVPAKTTPPQVVALDVEH